MEWVIFSTISIDGRLATAYGDSELSCEHDLRRLHEWRCWSDLVLVGANTAMKDDPGLFVKRVPCRHQPFRGVVDGRLRIPHTLRLFKEVPWLSLVITTEHGIRNYPWKFRYFRSLGVKVVVAGEGPSIDWGKAKEVLNTMGIRRVMIEGGGNLNWSLIKDNVVDRLEITYVGKVLGGGPSFAWGDGVEKVREAPSFKPERVELCECGRCVHVSWKRIS
ncbi:5-amino-6-(5-phosphoribosylamino)uracil reductase [Ignicoccus pacificus DSM 13166]|uniref:5-amino-6-(5-phosphoribosylamino)uracil reductase n=1 Tax=Ignicoccus pacificus DSM 13166 TaxID=940294 RepID=A0A977KAY6_9CREN|nr:5-amino-6-(5-phosphoribosylamino)uracil reductase [Ignicoccus pacificus DSM 13166]